MVYESSLVDDILKQADIVNVISSYINVIRKGRSFVSLCPFHDDKNPSMMISKEKQIFKCFVCGAGGNAISFVEKYERIPFAQAIRKTAEIIGFSDIRLTKPYEQVHVDETLVPLHECIEDLTTYYQYGLATEEGAAAREYLEKRHIDQDQQERFRLGYAIKDGKGTISFLEQKGYSLKTIESIGIALAKANGTSDSNAGRLIFPIQDIDGKVIGYSARKLFDETEGPKYVNSPETKLFHKSSILYNFHNAKLSAKHDGYIYVLEGFMDVFALDKIGIKSAIAIMGTALTKEQALILRRLNVEIRLCLDGDSAGQMAMMRIMSVFDAVGLKYRLVSEPGNEKDPDDILQNEGEERLRKYLNMLVDPFEFALNYYQNTNPLGSLEDRQKVINHFLPTLIQIPKGIDLDNRIFKLAKVTRFEPQAIAKFVEEGRNKSRVTTVQVANLPEMEFKPFRKDLRRLQNAERQLLYNMFQDKSAVSFYEENVQFFYIEVYRHIALHIIDYLSKHDELDVSLLINEIALKESVNKDEIIDEITSLNVKNLYPKANDKTLHEVKNVIKEETQNLYEKEALQKSLIGKTPREQARIIDDYNRRKMKKIGK
ncbi:MAG: DNA primase [Bacilli bacterium]|jgi:DNA primase|nr:DNA primase [Bacilli bacterium]MDD4005682.1 DNA primase [Bacilli bacterium]